MKTLAAIRGLSAQFPPLREKLQRAAGLAGRLLFFSLADESVSPRRSLSVSLEKTGLSVVYGRRLFSRLSVKGERTFPFAGYPSPEDLASSVDLAAKELGAAGAPVSISIPKAWTVIKTFSLPSSVKANLPEVVSYEMDRITPFSADEAFYDFELVQETGEGLNLIVAAAKADLVNPYLDALRDRGLPVERVATSVSGIGNLCLKRGWKEIIYMELSEAEYSGAVYSDGLITASFSRSLTGDDASKGEAVLSELDKWYQRMGSRVKIIVSVQDQASSLADRLRGVRDLLFLSKGEPGFGISAREASYSAVGCLVEALWPKARGLNLLMKGYRERVRPPFFLTGVLCLAGVAMAVAYTVMPLQIETKRIAEIDRQIEMRKAGVRKVEALKKEIGKMQSEVSAIDGFKGKGPMNLDILKEITAIIPKQAWLTRVLINEGSVQIEGFAKTATELLPKIEASRYFKKVEFALPTVRDESMKAERFAIKMEVEVPPANEKK